PQYLLRRQRPGRGRRFIHRLQRRQMRRRQERQKRRRHRRAQVRRRHRGGVDPHRQMINRTGRLAALALALLLMPAAPAGAQTVQSVLNFLLTNQSVQTGSVERDRVAAQATTDTISRAMLANLATLPVPTSSSGFVYQLNPELGTVERATKSFGPFFVERAQTAGRGQASAGVTFEHVHFASLDGRSLRDGTFVTTANK